MSKHEPRCESAPWVALQTFRSKWILVGFLGIAAFFLWTEHRAHLLGALPYLLLLACPLMHVFHHGHGHHQDAEHSSQTKGRRASQERESS